MSGSNLLFMGNGFVVLSTTVSGAFENFGKMGREEKGNNICKEERQCSSRRCTGSGKGVETLKLPQVRGQAIQTLLRRYRESNQYANAFGP
jgi:hypothetical protein